jgi:sodium transport system permease protein
VNLRNIGIVYRKELKDMLRDRRTLFGMIVFPLILFPIMSVGIGTVTQKAVRKASKERMTVMVLGAEHAPELLGRLRSDEGFEIVDAATDYVERIGRKELRCALEIPPEFEAKLRSESSPPKLTIHYYTAELRSEAAADRLEDFLRKFRDEQLQKRLKARQLPAAMIKPVEVKRENVAAAEKVGGLQLGRMIPYFIVFLCLMGALHPAMDLTAGEKERGTLETILASGVTRRDLVLGKFLLVLTVSLITAATSITSFAVTTRFAKDYMQEMTRGQAYSVSPVAILSTLLLVIPLAVFFSALVLTISIYAKSYKEAQNQTGPLMMVALLPAIVSMLPGIELNTQLAMVPILNVCLVAQQVFTGTYPWGMMGVAFASSCVFAALALHAAIDRFQREDVLFRV